MLNGRIANGNPVHGYDDDVIILKDHRITDLSNTTSRTRRINSSSNLVDISNDSFPIWQESDYNYHPVHFNIDGDNVDDDEITFIEIYHLDENNNNSSTNPPIKSIPLILNLSPQNLVSDGDGDNGDNGDGNEEKDNHPETIDISTMMVPIHKEEDVWKQIDDEIIFQDSHPPNPSNSTSTEEEKNKINKNSELFVTLFDMGYTEEQINHALKRSNSISSAIQLLTPNLQSESESYRAQCPICFDNYPLSEMITLDCLHRLCLDCFRSFCESKINENEVLSTQLCCPILVPTTSTSSGSQICAHPITIHEIKANINEQVFQKYERFITRSFCENEKLTSCPKCNEWYVDLQEVLHLEHLWKAIQCQKCQHKFCGKCGQVPHKGQVDQDVDCEGYAKWLEENTKSDDKFEKYIQSHKLFACPKCKMYGALESGCKFMYCRCKENFCALCGQSLKQSEHFSHFGTSGPFGASCNGLEKKAKEKKEKAKGKKGRDEPAGAGVADEPVEIAIPVAQPVMDPFANMIAGINNAFQVAIRNIYPQPPLPPPPVPFAHLAPVAALPPQRIRIPEPKIEPLPKPIKQKKGGAKAGKIRNPLPPPPPPPPRRAVARPLPPPPPPPAPPVGEIRRNPKRKTRTPRPEEEEEDMEEVREEEEEEEEREIPARARTRKRTRRGR